MKLALLAACLFPVAAALANGGGYVAGVESTGAFQPVGIGQVEMLSERLEIDLHLESADIRIEYVLHNPGKKVKIEAGFPSAIWTKEEYGTPASSDSGELKEFSLHADGKPLNVSRVADELKLDETSFYFGREVKSWYRFKLDFAEGQTRRLVVRYKNPYHVRFSTVSEHRRSSPLSLTYLFSSAAAWAGPIRQGTVIVRAEESVKGLVAFNHPDRFQPTRDGWSWNFTDFEPTLEDDLVIKVRPAYETYPASSFIPGEESGLVGDYWVFDPPPTDQAAQAPSGKWFFFRRDYAATASSRLPSGDPLTYEPDHVRNYSRSEAWVEGVQGDGVGESLTLTLKTPAKVTRVGVANGYCKSEELYLANGRAEELAVSVNEGKPFTVRVPDEYLASEFFYFDLPASKEPVKTVKLTLAKVRSGAKYQDTAISEVVLVQPLAKAPKIEPVR